MSIINTTIIDNQFVFIGSHVAIQVNRLSLFTGLDYWTGVFPLLDKLSIWFLKIFDTWRSQFFLKQS